MVFETARPPQTKERVSNRLGVKYFVDPREVHEYNPKKWRKLDEQAENSYVHKLSVQCQNEQVTQRRMMEEAQGWFSINQELMDRARKMDLKSCQKLKKFGYH